MVTSCGGGDELWEFDYITTIGLNKLTYYTGAPTVVFVIYKPLPFVREFNLLKATVGALVFM